MTCRFLPIGYTEAGQPMVLDFATDAVVPRNQAKCHGDCRRCARTDAVVRRGEKLPGSGPRKCWNCGLEWTLNPGEEDVCPRCHFPNAIKEMPKLKLQVVWKDSDESPEETMERSRKLVRRAKGLDEPIPLTVGDLSITKEQENSPERVRQRLRTMEDPRFSIGDLSSVTDAKDSVKSQVQRAKALEEGLTVGQLFRGNVPQPVVSESQEVLMDMQRKHRAEAEEVQKIKAIMAEQELERETRRALRGRI